MKNGVLVATKPHIGVTKHKTCCLRYQQIRILVIQAQTPEFGDLPTALWFQEWGFRKGESSPSFLGESPSRRVGWLSMMDRDRFFSWFHHDKKWGFDPQDMVHRSSKLGKTRLICWSSQDPGLYHAERAEWHQARVVHPETLGVGQHVGRVYLTHIVHCILMW